MTREEKPSAATKSNQLTFSDEQKSYFRSSLVADQNVPGTSLTNNNPALQLFQNYLKLQMTPQMANQRGLVNSHINQSHGSIGCAAPSSGSFSTNGKSEFVYIFVTVKYV